MINQARRKARVKHGGEMQRVEFDDLDAQIEEPSEDVLAVDELLKKLEALDPKTRQIVNMRYFAGFTTQETSEALGVSASTIEREWRFIRTWLKNALGAA